MVAFVHNSRILRFLLILIIVALTVFAYASYSTNTTTFSPAPHLHDTSSSIASAELLKSHQNEINTNSIENGDKSGRIGFRVLPNDPNDLLALQYAGHARKNRKSTVLASNEGMMLIKKQQQQQQQTHHREPTIDEDAIADGGGGLDDVPDDVVLQRFANNDLLEEQYIQNIDNTLGNINNSNSTGNIAGGQTHTISAQQKMELQSPQMKNQTLNNKSNNTNNNESNNNMNKILDSDVLIPTSNLQKFIENADKILKNISSTPLDAATLAGTGSGTNDKVMPQKQDQQHQQQQKQEQHQSSKHDASNIVENNNADNNIQPNDEALPPSAIMKMKKVEDNIMNKGNEDKKNPVAPKANENKVKEIPKKVNTSVTISHSADNTLHGVLTEHIYEKGHRNDEINIAKICPNDGTDIKLLILITSAPSHEEARLAIRQTWGHYGMRRDVSIAFLLGRTVNENYNLALKHENFIYGDLIRGNFIDSYNNLTLKTVSSLEWVDQHCRSAKYILKTDDDMFINVPKLLSFLNSHSKDKKVIYGRLAKKWKPIRNKKSKYYVSTEQFAANTFPPFTTGPAYVLSSDTIHPLYESSLKQVYLKLEDVFTTGIVAQQLNIKRVHVNEFLNRRIAFNPCNIRKTISVHMIKANEQFDLWKKLLDQTTKCK